MYAARWNHRATRIEKIEKLNLQAMEANRYSRSLMETVRMQAAENGILCERDIAHANQVAIFDEENRMLKASLADAVDRLEEQDEQINDLIDEAERLSYQVEVLEEALSKFKLSEGDVSIDLSGEINLFADVTRAVNTAIAIINFAI
jgi:hypothetical protein